MDITKNKYYTKANVQCEYPYDIGKIEQLDHLNNQIDEYKKILKNFKYKNEFNNYMLHLSTDTSSQMEGTQISDKEIEDITINSKYLSKEIKDIKNARTCGAYILENIVSQDTLLEANRIILSDSTRIHGYKKNDNWIGQNDKNLELAIVNDHVSLIPVKSDYVELFMNVFIERFNNQKTLIDNIILHYHFESIHPFNDGNGRIGRILFGKFMNQNYGIPLFVDKAIQTYGKHKYIDALYNYEHTKDITTIINYFIDIMIKQIEININRIDIINSYYIPLHITNIKPIYFENIDKILRFNTYINTSALAKQLDITMPTAKKYIQSLQQNKIIEQMNLNSKTKWFKIIK
jgi:Fic family protein